MSLELYLFNKILNQTLRCINQDFYFLLETLV